MVEDVGVEIFGVASGTGAPLDKLDVPPVDRIGQLRGVGVTEGAVVQVHSHRVVGRMTGPDAGRVVGDQVAGWLAIHDDAGMIDEAMFPGPVMTGETAGGVDAVGNDLLDGDAGGGGGVSGLIMAQGAGVLVQVEDAGPGVARA